MIEEAIIGLVSGMLLGLGFAEEAKLLRAMGTLLEPIGLIVIVNRYVNYMSYTSMVTFSGIAATVNMTVNMIADLILYIFITFLGSAITAIPVKFLEKGGYMLGSSLRGLYDYDL
ncbi:hypothetical protein [Pyrodictium abyssi]|uniref:Uncharacterized protein n=1 Tax=Pyrodictium abyssi TaxID=54256 RepID=A0ABN6ZQL8_9CREN|nr:hypothetical protein PABY_21230 [Pyrodictium abyssi]